MQTDVSKVDFNLSCTVEEFALQRDGNTKNLSGTENT